MSELSVTKITDRVGTGKVNFSQGFKVAGTLDTTLAPTRTEGNTEPATPVNGDTWYDTDNDTYDVYINDEWKRFLGAGGGAVSWTADVSSFSYDSVSFSVVSQSTSCGTIRFNTDGTKAYTCDINSGTIYQYSLTTGFDISTASYDSVSFDASTQEANTTSFFFNTDGTKMYVIGFGDVVYQYSLSTAFNVGTATYDSVSFTSNETLPRSLFFSVDGTKMYVLGQGNDTVYEYTLSTGFDLSTASYNSVSLNVSSQETLPSGVFFNPDGTKMYICGQTSDSIHQYTLSTGFDLSTASYDNSSFNINTSGSSNYSTGLAFNADGTKAYITDSSLDSFLQYSTGL